LGLGDTSSKNVPTLLTTNWNDKVVDIFMAHHHSHVLTESGDVWSTGDNTYSQLGLGYDGGQITTHAKMNYSGWESKPVQIACNGQWSVGKTLNGKLYTWGDGGQGKLCQNSSTNFNIPTVVSLFSPNVTGFVAGDRHVLVIGSDNEVYSAGDYKLGYTTTADVWTLTRIN
jgi:alpha-tubulin suppressor-like RCC1 family protein